MLDDRTKYRYPGQVRVRFAPSPTGYLHLGSARTALYNFLFARHNKGIFILRIEDTDRVRSRQEYLEEILGDLKWLGLNWDEGPFFQSERKNFYDEFAQRLLDEGKAYRDEGAIRFKMPPEQAVVKDLIHGRVEFDNTLLEDLVIIKSDGLPAYNFACVVDDIQMGITHIIRGDDHLSNTPKQTALYKALGILAPVFAHSPLILGPDRSPLSKRHGATAIKDYRRQGYLAQALVNYLTLLGWSPPAGGQEIMSRDKIIGQFNLKKVNKTAAIFDMDKLNWMNGEYIRGMKLAELAERIGPILKEAGLTTGAEAMEDKDWLVKFCALYQKRLKILGEIVEAGKYFFMDKIDYEAETVEKYLRDAAVLKLLRKWAEELKKLENFETGDIETSCRQLAGQLGISAAEIIHPARVALTGRSASPGLFELMALLGRQKCLKRLTACAWQ